MMPHNVKVESVEYLGKRAVKITEAGEVPNGEVSPCGSVRAPKR